MHEKGFLIVLAVLVLGAFFLVTSGAREDNGSRPRFERSIFAVVCANRTRFIFAAEVAKNPEEQAYGLMFKPKMSDDEAMIFLFPSPREAVFWMKNTLIPLDMLFIRPGGIIGHIVADAQPMNASPIYSQEPVIAVIEIKGGLAKKNGFNVGDRIESPLIQQQPPTQ